MKEETQKEIDEITKTLEKIGFELAHEDKEFNLYFKKGLRIALDFEGVEEWNAPKCVKKYGVTQINCRHKYKDLIEVEKWATKYLYVMSATENTILMKNLWVVTVVQTISEYMRRWKNE